MYSNDVLEDIGLTMEKMGRFQEPGYSQLKKDLTEFDYHDQYVNASGAFGDTRKYTAEYTIGKYSFKYYHVLPEGEIFTSLFTITTGNIAST